MATNEATLRARILGRLLEDAQEDLTALAPEAEAVRGLAQGSLALLAVALRLPRDQAAALAGVTLEEKARAPGAVARLAAALADLPAAADPNLEELSPREDLERQPDAV